MFSKWQQGEELMLSPARWPGAIDQDAASPAEPGAGEGQRDQALDPSSTTGP